MKKIKAKVNPRLLKKADRLFTGTVWGRVIEILQNARRAGATNVDVTNAEGWVTVQDNGRGVDDFGQLLDMGASGWDDATEQAEDPAGVGLFCLAPRALTIRSRGKMVTIEEAGWTGQPVEVLKDQHPIQGTELRFRDDVWDLDEVELNAVFSGLTVTVDGKTCQQLPFVSQGAAAHPELGSMVEVCDSSRIAGPYSAWSQRKGYGNVLVNFHGQVACFDYRPLEDQHLFFLVDMTGRPTGIRLMLPARTRLVENAAFEELKKAIELEALRYVQRQGEHRLHYRDYLRAKDLGIGLPEAKPVYSMGLLESPDPPDPVEVKMPEGFALGKCYLLNPGLRGSEDKHDVNAHLLGALGGVERPFVPVSISQAYEGYGWAKLATVDKVEVSVGKKLHESLVWSEKLECVESLAVSVRTSDGKAYSSEVCMAVLPPEEGPVPWMNTDRVLVTPEAQKRLCVSDIWFHLGGWYLDGDTYDTQEEEVRRQLERFWADLVGPEEHFRQKVMEAMNDIDKGWQTATVLAGGHITIRLADGQDKVIAPPGCGNAAAAWGQPQAL